MRHKFQIVATDGLKDTVIDCDSVKVVPENGEYIELHPRRSDGEITLSTKNRLVIRPIAGNCARVESER